MPGEGERRPLAFAIMPFDDTFDQVWELLIVPALDAAGYTAHRADSLLNQQNILRDVVRGIVEADLVVADVTGLNENVLYELGLAHALGKRCVMITRSIDELPFDLRPYRAFEYSVAFNQADKLKDFLTRVATAAQRGDAEFGTPVRDFAPELFSGTTLAPVPPGDGRSVGQPDEPDREEKADDDSGDDSPGLLERQVALDAANAELVSAAEEITALTVAIGAKTEAHTARIAEIQARLGERAAGAALAQTRLAASDYDEYAAALANPRQRMAEALNEYIGYADAVATTLAIDTEEEAETAMSMSVMLSDLAEALGESYTGTMDFSATMFAMPHMSKDLTRAARRAGRELSETGSVILGAQAEVTRVASLLRQRADNFRRGGEVG